MPKAAIYARLAIKGGHDFGGCLKKIDEAGYKKPMLFLDINEDGYDFDRPEFKRMMICVKEGIVDYVIVPSILQFTRDMSDALEAMETFRKAGASVYFLDIGMGSEDFDKNPESFIKLLDQAFSLKDSETYGEGDVTEEELASKKGDFEIYIDDLQIVDDSLFDKEEDDDA